MWRKGKISMDFLYLGNNSVSIPLVSCGTVCSGEGGRCENYCDFKCDVRCDIKCKTLCIVRGSCPPVSLIS